MSAVRIKAQVLKSRLFGGGGTASGVLGGIGSIHNVCHSLCVTVVSILAIFGITTSILPLMFLQTYQMYFWVGALVFTVASFYFYLQQKRRVARDRNLLFINFGLLIFGLPAVALAEAGLPLAFLADYMDFFRFVGVTLTVGGLFLLLFGKRFKTVYRPIPNTHLRGAHSVTSEVLRSQVPSGIWRSDSSEVVTGTATSLKLPKLNVSSALFAVVVAGFLVNQYLMYRMEIFGKVNNSVNSTATSAMKSLSRMKLTPFDVALAKERMDKNNDGICDVCGMSIQQCIDSGQIDCNMGNNSKAIGVLGSQHIHADFKVYVNGQAVDFSDKDHMGRMRDNLPVSSFIHVDSGSPLPEKTGDVLHMHAKNVPLWMFFKSIGMKLEKDSLTLDDGKVYENENGNILKFYLNGKKVDELGEYVFQPLDKLLISYGSENDPDVQRQIGSVTNFAKDHQK